MTEGSPQRPGSEAFTAPDQVNQRRYEAIRAWYVEALTYQQAATRYGYTRWAMIDLVRQWRAGKLDLFAPPRKPGPPPGTAPAKDRARARVIQLRRQGLSSYEISARLTVEQTPLNRTSVAEILSEEGFGRLLRHPEPEASINPATPGRDTNLPAARVIPALSWLLTLLVLKLTRTRRVSHVDDLLADPAAALFTGMATLPKKSALTSYSYRLAHDHQQRFLAALDTTMIDHGLASSDQAIFDLDFHAVMHWGTDPALEKHYVPTRSQRARSVLTFFAQDTGTHNLVYANADTSKATQAREVIAFCDHWKAASGKDPAMLIMDQKVTTHHVLGELDQRGVKFLTLRMRSPALVRHINALPPAAYKTVTLDRPGPHNKPRVHEDPHARLTDYPGTVRQLVVTGLGHQAPTVIITNERNATIRDLISRYARRMTIEQRLAEIIRAFCADALSSTVNLNVDLDIMLTVLAQALLAALRGRLPGYAAVTPDTIQRRFLETPGTIITTNDTITVHLERRAYTPVLRAADLPTDTRIPWLGNRTIRYELS